MISVFFLQYGNIVKDNGKVNIVLIKRRLELLCVLFISILMIKYFVILDNYVSLVDFL